MNGNFIWSRAKKKKIRETLIAMVLGAEAITHAGEWRKKKSLWRSLSENFAKIFSDVFLHTSIESGPTAEK